MKDEFKVIYDRYFSYICPPTESNSHKQEGCFNAFNNYNKEPTDENCMKCWKHYLRNIIYDK